VTCLALLAFASGCSGLDEPEPALQPVLSARGRIIYVAKDSGVPPFREDPQNARLIQQARDAQLRVQGPGPQDAPSSPQGRGEPIRVAKADPEAENIERLERRVRLLNAQRDDLFSQEKPRSSLAERQQADREWHRAWQARRDRDHQEDAMRDQLGSRRFNDGFRELLRTQEQMWRQQ
jgi:hypothetical protein